MKIKKIVSIILAAIMLLSIVPVSAFAAEIASVNFSVSVADNGVQINASIAALDGTAERFGYKVAEKDHNNVKVDGVTVFDIIVAAHANYYDAAFRKETAEKYLVIENGYITKAFGKTGSVGFTVNGIMPHDGIINPTYGQYTSYASDTARVKDGDDIRFFFYQDTKYYSDLYSWFDSDCYKADLGEEVTVHLSGYTAMYYGVNDWETIVEEHAIPLEGATVYATKMNGEEIVLGKTDKDGNLTFTVNARSYVIHSGGTAIDEFGDEVPVIPAYTIAKGHYEAYEPVVPGDPNWSPFKEFLYRIMDFFGIVKDIIVNAFKFMFGKIKVQ